MIAAVKIRGDIDASKQISDTIKSLGLEKNNQVLFIEEDNEPAKGMLNKAKDYIGYGEVSSNVIEELEQEKNVEVKPGNRFSMTPPSKGFRSTKENYNAGGALGKRPSMDELLKDMI